MVALGEEHGVRTRALLTRMDIPLGRAVGNAVEVRGMRCGADRHRPADLMQVTLALAAEMLALAGIEADPAAAITDGRALEAFRAMVRAQGGDPDAPLPQAAHVTTALAGARRRLADRAGRAGRGHRRLAARRGPGAQGGPGERRRGRDLPGQAG